MNSGPNDGGSGIPQSTPLSEPRTETVVVIPVSTPNSASVEVHGPNSTSVNQSVEAGEAPGLSEDTIDGHRVNSRQPNVRTFYMSAHQLLSRRFSSRHGKWTCFMCLHVRTGTALIGGWHLLLQVLTLALLTLAALYPDLLNNGFKDKYRHMSQGQDIQAVNCTIRPCSLAAHPGSSSSSNFGSRFSPDYPLALGHLLSTHQVNSDALGAAVFITLFTLLVTLFLLYGVHKKCSAEFLPFLFMQGFDVCVYVISLMGYMSNISHLRRYLVENPAFPFRDTLLSMKTNCLTLAVLTIGLTTCFIKYYCLHVVWRCYKYILLSRAAELTGHSPATLIAAGARAGRRNVSSAPEHCQQWLLQSEGRGKLSGAFPDPPPSYDMAMAAGPAVEGQASGISPGDDNLLPRYEDAVAASTAEQGNVNGTGTTTAPPRTI